VERSTRLGWFRPAAEATVPDSSGPLVAELTRHATVEVFDEARAHDFVWMRVRQPFDLVVFELGAAPGYRFVWPYLLHFPDLLYLRGLNLSIRHRWAIRAARMVVVDDGYVAEGLQDEFPDARIRAACAGVGKLDVPDGPRRAHGELLVGVLGRAQSEIVERAAARARAAGTAVVLIASDDVRTLAVEADVIVTLDRSGLEVPRIAATAALPLARPLIVLETAATAAWPALDPQTWQPRDPLSSEAPIVISIDPRDEEHSLVLALRRLAGDVVLRERLASAAARWWQRHATVAHAASAWRRIIAEALATSAPRRPADWPGDLTPDGTEMARSILAEFGLSLEHCLDLPTPGA
jgi:hypothetical protein